MRKIILLLIFVSCKSATSILNVGETKSKNYYSEINFEWVANKIIVPVEIQGKTYRFMLDSGAPNMISKEIYNLIKPKLIASLPVKDVNGIMQSAPVVSVKNTVFGGVSFENVATLVHDFKKNSVINCFQLDGIIGSNMLRNSIVQINLETKKVILTDNKKRLDLNSRNSQKIKFINNQSSPYIWIKLKGNSTAKEQVLIDTGAESLYSMSRGNFKIFENKNILKSASQAKGFSSVGMFGKPKTELHHRILLPLLKIGKIEIKNYLTQTSNSDNSAIGANLLNYGIITLDYKNKRFYFKPKNKEVSLKSKHYGFSKGIDGNKLIIGFVWDKDLKNKLHYGDEILEINGKKVVICNYILDKEDIGEELKLKIRPKKGEIFEIVVHKK